MDSIDVSVIIPTFHREELVGHAIRSALNQTSVTVEVIVMDDSANGSARESVESLLDPRVQYHRRTSPSQGRPALVRNDGATHARGNYLHFLDDDDMLAEGALSALVQALDSGREAGMAFGVVQPFGTNEQALLHNQRYFSEARRVALKLKSRGDLAACLMFRPAVLNNSACMARRAVFEAVGGFDSEIAICEDADLWGRIADHSGFVFVDRPVVQYRTGAPSLMHSLVENDPRLHSSYQHMQAKYRQRHGHLPSLFSKLWVKTCMR